VVGAQSKAERSDLTWRYCPGRHDPSLRLPSGWIIKRTFGITGDGCQLRVAVPRGRSRVLKLDLNGLAVARKHRGIVRLGDELALVGRGTTANHAFVIDPIVHGQGSARAATRLVADTNHTASILVGAGLDRPATNVNAVDGERGRSLLNPEMLVSTGRRPAFADCVSRRFADKLVSSDW
jgi:hypothetical protein